MTIPKVAAEVVIKYNDQDITQHCSISESTFTTRASGSPGEARVTFKDTRQRFVFVPGKKLELFIDDERAWDGYARSLGYNYWFETHTANCEPCPHVTPRKMVLYGADRNILLKRRVMYNKADPEGEPWPPIVYFPANTPDDEVIVQFINDYIDDIDGVDYTTKVEHVGSPDPYIEFRVPGPSDTLLTLLDVIARSTGAIYYIDPDRFLVYTDVNTPDAPWVLTDRPTAAGEIGYQGVTFSSDGGRLINDAMVWGAGQGSPNIVFKRVEDEDSIAAHGRWQNTGGFRFNLWQASSVQRVADSIIYGSPSNKRGHKDPVISVRCKTFHHGFRVAQKAEVISEVFDFSDVIPIREMTISFINPHQPQYELVLSHDIDEPWTTSEFWWPKDDGPGPEGPGPGTQCNFPMFTNTGIGVVWGENSGERPPNREATLNGIEDTFAIVADGFPGNKWIFYQDLDGLLFTGNNGGDISIRYEQVWADYYWYNIGAGDLQIPGEAVLTWRNEYVGLQAPPRTEEEEEGGPSFYYCHITGNVELQATAGERDVAGFVLGVSRVDNDPNMTPQLVQIGRHQPRTGYTTSADGVARLEPSPLPHHQGDVLWEANMVDNEIIPFDLTFTMSASDTFYLGIDIAAPAGSKPWLVAEAHIEGMELEWTKANVNYMPILGDEDGVECFEVGFGSTNVHLPATLLYGTTYRVPMPYVPGTTRVYVDGIHWTDYTESSPTLGQITLGHAVDGEVTVAYITAVSNLAVPDAPNYFIPPTAGPVTATFGAQTSGWPPAYYNGVWYDHFHNGVDFGVSTGSPVWASADGFVRHEDQFAGGTMIHIYHENGLRSVYAHLSQRLVADGVTVSQGDLIAYSGATGDVTGPHLHWGCVFQGSPVDPRQFAQGFF